MWIACLGLISLISALVGPTEPLVSQTGRASDRGSAPDKTRRRMGEKATDVEIEALDLHCSGQIDQIVPEADARSRVFEVRVSGPCPPGAFAGMFGRLHVPVGTHHELRIPDAAVWRVGQVETVFVVGEGDVLQRRFVQTGRRPNGAVEVLAGLSEGERIVARAKDATP